MDTTEFETQVGQILREPVSPTYREAVTALQSIARAIQKQLGQDGPQVAVEPGCYIALGQQLNVAVRVPRTGFEEVLFRAYVPDTGYPIGLDLFGGEPVECADEMELQNQVLAFLRRPEVRNRMAWLRETAAG